jgi:hypothetical protein
MFIQIEGNKSCNFPSESAVNTYLRTEVETFCHPSAKHHFR